MSSPTPGRPNPNFEPFFNAVLQQIGMALDIPHEVLTKRLLDERFLVVHPATALWAVQRADCERCGHMRQKANDPAMRCSTTILQQGRGGNPSHSFAYCIDARAAGELCGPEARLFVEAS